MPIEFINQMEPWFDDCEAIAIKEYMASGGWVTEFKKTREFESMIANYTGAKYCSVVSNGTISLTIALIACGVGPGDEVLVPDYTMVATANSVRLAGAEVVFVDIDPNDLCMDYKLMRKAVSKKTKAVMLVSINGRCPSNISEYVDFCVERNIKLIEDAAQSLGSFKDGHHLGTYGNFGSFSFSAPKVITTGQGGALITNDFALFERVQKLRDFGRESSGADHYLTMGWNFKFTDIQAIIGIEQMKKLKWRLERKKEIYSLYEKMLSNVSGLKFIDTDVKDTSPWFIDVLVKNGKRAALIEHLRKHNIGTRPFYPALHSEPVYNYKGEFPVAESIAKEGLWLPSASKLTNEQVERVCSEIIRFYAARLDNGFSV